MPETYDKNPRTKSVYDGEAELHKKYAELGRRITDNVGHKLKGLKTTDEEYWGLREILNEHEVDVALSMKQRKWYTYEELFAKNKQLGEKLFKETLDLLCVHGFVEYDYGDHYDDNGPIPGAPKELRYRTSYFVPGSAELFNSSVSRIEENPPVTKMFERMTFLPLEHITSMVRPGGNGIGMHVIPVEKEVQASRESMSIEKISYWLQKYDGHLSAGICSCRASRAMLGEGCTDDESDWCIQVGDMADYTVETGRAHYITKEEALEILKRAEENGYVHQVTNIDGADHIFDICNCNVKICNALRTSLLFNTPNMSKSAYTANVKKENCVACGRCVEICPAGALKLGQKLCTKDGKEIEYPKSVLPDRIRWGKYAWDENYRDTRVSSNTWEQGSAPCKAACPAHVPIQAYLKLARDGQYREALAMIKTENPFPSVCGRVCNKRCEDACTRGTVDAPVSIDAVKKFVADLELRDSDRYVPEKTVQSIYGKWDEKIAIIGGGPAGLSAAYYLAEMGYAPTVFEKNPVPGGMLTYGIPSYKLEKDVIEAEIDVLRKMGVEIKCGVNVGEDVTLDELRAQGYKAFYIAIGCQGGRRPGVKNDTAEGTDIAVSYLRKSYEHRKRFTGSVVVVGGGNVAVDCARNAHRLGASSVRMFSLETRDIMPATRQEITEALEEDIAILNGWGPKEVLADDSANPVFVASDLLSQAEHGVDSQAILITTSEQLANEVMAEVERQLAILPRKEIAEKSVANSKIFVVKDMQVAVAMTNSYAPEHLIVSALEYRKIAEQIDNAGSIFLGYYTPESAGDYASGTNHTLPTNGYAKAYSGVNLDSFRKKITYQEITKEGLDLIGDAIEVMASNEHLFAHQNAVVLRRK